MKFKIKFSFYPCVTISTFISEVNNVISIKLRTPIKPWMSAYSVNLKLFCRYILGNIQVYCYLGVKYFSICKYFQNISEVEIFFPLKNISSEPRTCLSNTQMFSNSRWAESGIVIAPLPSGVLLNFSKLSSHVPSYYIGKHWETEACCSIRVLQFFIDTTSIQNIQRSHPLLPSTC